MTDKPNRLWELAYGINPEKTLRDEAKALRERMAAQLGEPKARALWQEAGKPPRGRMKGSKKYDIPYLLRFYDTGTRDPEFAGWEREKLARFIANFAHSRKPGAYGASVLAITKAITRALKERDQQDAERSKLLASMAGPAGLFGARPADQSILASLLMLPDNKSRELLSGRQEIADK